MKKQYISDEKAGLSTMRDPMVMVHGDTYYLTGTQPPYWDGYNDGVHLWSSKDMISFTYHGLILKRSDMTEDMWCVDRFWAPELFDGKDGWFYLTFNCKNKSEKYYHTQACGLARSRNVTGPYEILTPDTPLTEKQGHANDAHLFRDDNGEMWFASNIARLGGQTLHKIDLEKAELGEFILVGGVGEEGEWDHVGVEGACIVKRHGIYFHWYSSWTLDYDGGVFTTDNVSTYRSGIFTSDSMRGPWIKSPQNPILDSNGIWHKAGHNHSFTGLDGKDYIIFHANLKKPDGEDVERVFIRRVDYLPDGTVKIYENIGFGEQE